jgi:uncharacterized coiled-coil DUF342 family protein
MTTNEPDKLTLFLLEKYEEAISELQTLKDAQLRTNTQLEKLTKVVFGLLEQIGETKVKLELQQKEIDGWQIGWPPSPTHKAAVAS